VGRRIAPVGRLAQVFELTLVTRNVRNVAWTGAVVLNPFRPPRR